MGLFATLSTVDTRHNSFYCHYAECHYAECLIFYCYAECRYAECRYAECHDTICAHNLVSLGKNVIFYRYLCIQVNDEQHITLRQIDLAGLIILIHQLVNVLIACKNQLIPQIYLYFVIFMTRFSSQTFSGIILKVPSLGNSNNFTYNTNCIISIVHFINIHFV